MTGESIQYFVFDIESVADGELIRKVRFPGEELDSATAVSRYRAELMEKSGSDFIPYTFQIPTSIVIAKVSKEFRLIDLVSLDAPHFRPHEITRLFWAGWKAYQRPTLVTFNGRTFDVPLLELAAFRYGVSVPDWFNVDAKSWEQNRNRYNHQAHLDLYDLLTNYGASRFNGGLNLAANLLGKPGKIEVQGNMVQDLFDAGQLEAINDYCQCDVLDTYFVLLRAAVMRGQLSLDEEHSRVEETRKWLEERSASSSAFQTYLREWGNWPNPWTVTDASPH
ncbi:MAG: 3'-5' exonuclease [Planctomycetota bacterium]|nr:3'-5' exonuclease [Planctomycetota bacterium]